MSPTITVILIIVVLVVIAAVVYGLQAGRRRKLRSTFGPEYDRVVADTGSRTEAEKELRERERRHSELEIKELSPESQARYAQAWAEVQILFVDNPSEAVGTADDLVTRLMAERGYPTGGYDERVADLSVAHANTIQHYRDAHDISDRNKAGSASTEDLRVALVHYRALFADLLGTDPVPVSPAGPTPATSPESTPSESTRSETVSSDSTRPEAARSDATRSEAARSDTTLSEAARSDASRSEASRSEAARSEAARSESVPSESARSTSVPSEDGAAPAPRKAADDVARDTRR
jgi:hypothetical protein